MNLATQSQTRDCTVSRAVVPRTASLSLRRNAAWTVAGNLAYGGSQWGVLIVLAKLSSAEMVGQFILGVAVTSPIITFASLQLRAVQSTDVRGEYLCGHYVGLRLIMAAIAMVVIAGIALLAGYGGATAGVILGLGVGKSIDSISDALYGLFQKHQRMDCIGKSMLIKYPIALLSLAVTVYLTGSVLCGVLAVVPVSAAVLWTWDVGKAGQLLRHLRHREGSGTSSASLSLCPIWQRGTLLSLARRALPLGIVTMLGSLNRNIPYYVLGVYWGEAAVGLFAPMAYFIVGCVIVINAVGQSGSARLAEHYAQRQDTAYLSLILKMLVPVAVLGAIAMSAAVLYGREVLETLYGLDYAQRVDVFIWLMVALCLNLVGVIFGYAVTATRLFAKMVLPYSTVTVFAIVSSALWIPKFGLLGAAWATCVVTLGNCVVPLFIMRKAWQTP